MLLLLNADLILKANKQDSKMSQKVRGNLIGKINVIDTKAKSTLLNDYYFQLPGLNFAIHVFNKSLEGSLQPTANCRRNQIMAKCFL